MRTVLALICLGFMVLGCNFGNSNNNNNSNNANNDNSSASNSSGDFSTPKAAVQTFIKAGSNRDKELLSQCFDSGGPGEFRRYREKTASQKDLDGLAEFVQGAEVGEASESGDSAMVKVKFKQRDEEIKMKRTDGKWRILDF
jgi:hypothetical protein